jgi:hypothetical protein
MESGPDVIPHAYKAHGMAIDTHDHVGLCYAKLSIVVVRSAYKP